MNDDELSVQGRLKKFDVNHGGNPIRVGGWLIYKDGAMREANPLGALLEPPGNVHARCKIIFQYHEELLQRAVNAFHEAKDTYLTAARARLKDGDPTPGSQQEIVEKLTQLQAEVKKRQQNLSIARKKLEASTPDWQRIHVKTSAANKQRNEKLISAISNIKI